MAHRRVDLDGLLARPQPHVHDANMVLQPTGPHRVCRQRNTAWLGVEADNVKAHASCEEGDEPEGGM